MNKYVEKRVVLASMRIATVTHPFECERGLGEQVRYALVQHVRDHPVHEAADPVRHLRVTERAQTERHAEMLILSIYCSSYN